MGIGQCPTRETLEQCMRAVVASLERRGREYYFFGGVSCQLLANTPRPTADIDLVIDNASMALPNPRDWLADQPFFWSAKHAQYVWATIGEHEEEDNVIYQGRCFVDIDVNVAGWGSFPKFGSVNLVSLPNNCGLSLSREWLLKLKLAGWAEKSRREGPKRANDYLDVVALRRAMYVEGELLDTDALSGQMKEGLKFWVGEFKDDREWRRIGVLFQLGRLW